MPHRRKNPLKLVIFDLDGVICDSEILHKFAKVTILKDLAHVADVDLSWSVGFPLRDMWSRLIAEYQLQMTPEELERKQYDVILDQMKAQNMDMSHGLRELMIWLKARDIQLGLCSSSNRYYVDRVVDHFNLRDMFDYVVAGDEVPQKKPAPDGYLKLLKLANVPAKSAIAIEDSHAGSSAAVTAGITCIGYVNPTSGNQDLSHATWLVDDLCAIPSFLFERIPA